MTNQQVVARFLAGETKGKAGNLYIEGSKLINYNTCLLQYSRNEHEELHVNVTKYSVSTSKIQSTIRKELIGDSHTIIEHADVRMGRSYLV